MNKIILLFVAALFVVTSSSAYADARDDYLRSEAELMRQKAELIKQYQNDVEQCSAVNYNEFDPSCKRLKLMNNPNVLR